MKNLLLIMIFCSLIVSSCSSSDVKKPCQELINIDHADKEWVLAKCYEEAAVQTKDIMLCNNIGSEVISKEGEPRIYSRATCRNMIRNAIAFATVNPKTCELIDEDARLYTEPPEGVQIKDSRELKEMCRDLLNN